MRVRNAATYCKNASRILRRGLIVRKSAASSSKGLAFQNAFQNVCVLIVRSSQLTTIVCLYKLSRMCSNACKLARDAE